MKHDPHLCGRPLALVSKIRLASACNMESKSRRCSASDIAFYQEKKERKPTRFSLLTSAGTRSSEKNDEDDDSGSVAKGDRCPLSTAPDAITIGAGTRASTHFPLLVYPSLLTSTQSLDVMDPLINCLLLKKFQMIR